MIIEIVGNTGSGKTTLAQALTQTGQFVGGIEQHAERPFQAAVVVNPVRYALSNQIDYLLFRAEQEQRLRKQPRPAILDGGLEEDFYVFTRLFEQKGFLTPMEYQLCERIYHYLRDTLGPPDLIIWLDVPLKLAEERYLLRHRVQEVAQKNDLPQLENNLRQWLGKAYGFPMVRLEGTASQEELLRQALDLIRDRFSGSEKA